MQDQTIKPVLPVNRTRDVIKKKQRINPDLPERPAPQKKNPDSPKKGIIDTYA